jgi:hypothetical protein
MERILKSGSSILIFPEGGHNNTENLLCNKLFAGPYILSRETDVKVVPIAPFYEYGGDTIYMNVGEPIDLAKFENKKDALTMLRDIFATMVYENIEKHSTHIIRSELKNDFHINFMEQRRKEYLKNSWTRDVWDEELTCYLDAYDKEKIYVMESMDNIQVTEKNASIMGPILVKRNEQKKYNFNDYMHRNWDKQL